MAHNFVDKNNNTPWIHKEIAGSKDWGTYTLDFPVPYEMDTTIESDSTQKDDVMMEPNGVGFVKY